MRARRYHPHLPYKAAHPAFTFLIWQVLAASGGPDLWTATRDKYLELAASPFSRTLQSIVHQDFATYVARSDLGAWKVIMHSNHGVIAWWSCRHHMVITS